MTDSLTPAANDGGATATFTFTPDTWHFDGVTFTARYACDGTFTGSSSSPVYSPPPPSSFTTLSSNINTVAPGQDVTLAATVTLNSDGVPNRAVTFYDDGTVLGVAVLVASSIPANNSAQATLTIQALAQGGHTIKAVYSGEAEAGTGACGYLSQFVKYAPAVALTSNFNPSGVGQPVTFTAQLDAAPDGLLLTGTVTFLDGTTVLGTVKLMQL